MSKDNNEILRWLQTRPLQDNPGQVESSAEQALASWDQWVNTGQHIPDIENELIRILEGQEDPVTRSAAALALGFIGGDQSLEPLVRSLQTEAPTIAMEAAASLGRLGRPEAVEPLCGALKHADPNVRANAAIALGALGGEQARSCLKSAEHDEDPFVQSAVAEALGNL